MLRKKDFSKSYETMKTTPHSSTKSRTSIAAESETKDNFCYFPSCRRDANCSCDICLASINATLDLMPQTIQRSTLTKKSSSKLSPITPISFNHSSFSTPEKLSSKRLRLCPPLNSDSQMCFHETLDRENKGFGYGLLVMRLALCIGLVFGLEFGVPWIVSAVLQPKLSVETVRRLGEKSWGLKDLNERMLFLKNELKGLVHRDVSICSSADSTWKINQDGLLLNSRCVVYKSMSEEVSIWGWPLQTSGLLAADFSARSLTILSGRVTEWFNGEMSYVTRKANSSWTQGKWSASAAQFDKNTWILEYKQNSIIENARLLSAVMEFLKFRLIRKVEKMKQEFWALYPFDMAQRSHLTRGSSSIPT